MGVPDSFRAFRIRSDGSGYHSGLEEVRLGELSPGEVVVRVIYSSVNFKDALAGTGQGKILRSFPLIGGIDLAGIVDSSEVPEFLPGQAVLVTGSGLSETRDGGYSEYARVEAKSVIALPEGLSLRESMILGTAGFTAALSLLRLVDNGQVPGLGPLAVTGATGGVGSLAVDVFSKAGFEVHAISGKAERASWLERLGASRVLDRGALSDARPLSSVRFGGGLDTLGGPLLVSLLGQTASYGSVVSAGLAADASLPATVMPFILRGVSLLGVASASCPRHLRERVWRKLAGEYKPRHLDLIHGETVELEDLPRVFRALLDGQGQGRVLVRVAPEP